MTTQFMIRYVTEEVQQAVKAHAKRAGQSQNTFILAALNWATNNKNRYRYDDVWSSFKITQEDAKQSKKFIIRFEEPQVLRQIEANAMFHLRSVNSELNLMVMTYMHHQSK